MKEQIVKNVYYTLSQLVTSMEWWRDDLLKEPETYNSSKLESLSHKIETLLGKVKESCDEMKKVEGGKVEDEKLEDKVVSLIRKEFEDIFNGKVCKNYVYQVFRGDRMIYTSFGTEKFPDNFKPKFFHDGIRIGTSDYSFTSWKNIDRVRLWKDDRRYTLNFSDVEFGYYYKLLWDVNDEEN